MCRQDYESGCSGIHGTCRRRCGLCVQTSTHMKVDIDLEQLEALEILRWEDLPVDSEERKEKPVGDQVVSMLSASSSQDALK